MSTIEKKIPCEATSFYTKPAHLNAIGGTIAEAVTELQIRPIFVIGHREKGALLAHTTALHLSTRSAWTTDSDRGPVFQLGYEIVVKDEYALVVFYKEMTPQERAMLIHTVRTYGCSIVGEVMLTDTHIIAKTL